MYSVWHTVSDHQSGIQLFLWGNPNHQQLPVTWMCHRYHRAILIAHISSVLVTVQSCGGETLPHEQVHKYQLSLEHQAPEHLKLDMLVTDRVIQYGCTSH